MNKHQREVLETVIGLLNKALEEDNAQEIRGLILWLMDNYFVHGDSYTVGRGWPQ